MKDDKIFELADAQERFADIVWANEPIASGDLVDICRKELNWKKSTTYTVLRKLCEKNLLQNISGVVQSLVSREEYYSTKSRQVVDASYAGSLPAFIAAFAFDKKLTMNEINEIQRMIDEFKREV
ncbi:MAG: BlaI/MecI/CopY family transcriptional regulator [Lachnospiraceae bacterium]|nr:BlaI/MecI/CopY family transcriptional regulator [Lachnospiraceae bacterium]